MYFSIDKKLFEQYPKLNIGILLAHTISVKNTEKIWYLLEEESKRFKKEKEKKYKEVIHVNTLVDLYNFISIKYGIPAGAYDLDNMKDNIIFSKYEEKINIAKDTKNA